MFSGLTNQVSSWMSSAKGEQEEKVPTPTEESTATTSMPQQPPAEGELEASSPTKSTKSKLDFLSNINVKSQIEGIGGWLGSSIPKLRKGEESQLEVTGEDNPVMVDESAATTGLKTASGSGMKDDDDNSRYITDATGGADSGPQSANDTPTDEKDGQFGQVQSKALSGAKSFGNFLYSAVNKAGKAVTETSAKIKETVEKNTLLRDFNKEQEAFIKEQGGNTASNLPPWTGCPNEEALKEECLSLSTDRRNFVRSPPAGVDYKFNYDESYPVAMAIMEQDPNLEKMRYELVPKVISEENFWRNYFYRVSLICQANELSSVTQEGESRTGDPYEHALDTTGKEAHEFVSDSLQASSEDLIEVEEALKKLAQKSKQKEEDWERELEAELQDYEVVSDQKSSNSKSENWEKDIEDMLEEVNDLK